MINKILKLAQEFQTKAELKKLDEYLGDEFVLSDPVIELVLKIDNVNDSEVDYLLNKNFDLNQYSILLSFLYGDNIDNYHLYLKTIEKLYPIYGIKGISDFSERVRMFKKNNKR